jgi:hypothetical protein
MNKRNEINNVLTTYSFWNFDYWVTDILNYREHVLNNYWKRFHKEIYLQYKSALNSSVMVFYATFNNISVILWQSVLLVKETRVPGENHQPVTSN